jgi:hypothetical protein
MSNSPAFQPNNDRPFWIAASLLMVLSAWLAASAWPAIRQSAHAQSDRLVQASRGASGSESRLDLKLAHILNPSSQPAALELAKQQLAAGQSTAALQTLKGAGEGSEATRLRLGVQLEQDQLADATGSAAQLAKASNRPQDLLLASLAYALAGKRELIDALTIRMTDSEALQRIQRAKANDLLLGTELYATGLPDSAQRILVKQPGSYERDYLLAQIAYARHTHDSLINTEAYLTSAIGYNASSIPARQLLVQVLRNQDKADEAGRQQDLLDRLHRGDI